MNKIKAASVLNLAAQALRTTPARLRELCEADLDGRVEVLKPEVRYMKNGKAYRIAAIATTEECGTMVEFHEEGNSELLRCNPVYFAEHYTRAEAEAALKEEPTDDTGR